MKFGKYKDFEIKCKVLVGYRGGGGDIIIPPHVIEIGEDAFYCNPHITSVKIPNNVNTIGRCAFKGCVNLQSIVIGDDKHTFVINLKDYCFSDCPNLKEIRLNCLIRDYSSLSWISGFRIFRDSGNLSDGISLTIGEKSSTLEENTFSGCNNVKELILYDNEFCLSDRSFGSNNNVESIIFNDRVNNWNIMNAREWGNLKYIYIDRSVRKVGGGIDCIPTTVRILYEGTEDEWLEITNGRICSQPLFNCTKEIYGELKRV